LLLKIGVAASIASVGVRSDAVKRMLLREERTLAQRVRLALWFAAIFTPGVLFRIMRPQSYSGLDLALEGSLLAGITGGYMCGWFAGMMIAVPSMFNHELVSLPFLAVVGLGGGLLRDAASDKEDIWRISSFPDANLRRIFQHRRELRSALFHLFFFFAVIATELLRQVLANAWSNRLLRHHSAEGLEQYTERSKAGRAGTAADSGAYRSAGEPDQPSLSVQYAEFDFDFDSYEPGAGPADGDAAVAYYEGTSAQSGPLCAPAR
jgi:hypothetical protein